MPKWIFQKTSTDQQGDRMIRNEHIYTKKNMDYGHMMTRFQILYSPNPYLNPKYVENPVKFMKILAFCRQKWLSTKSRTMN